MTKFEFEITSKKIYKRDLRIKVIRLALLILLIFLILLYFILSIIYEAGRFTIILDRNLSWEKGIVLYEKLGEKVVSRKLEAERFDEMDNISIDWLPQNIDTEAEGSHNGDNYLAYTFYIENEGKDAVNYWYSMPIDDVILNVDEAIRVMVYLNGEKTVYAKLNGYTEEPEEGTKAFYSDDTVMLESRQDFAPGDIDKFTIVVWIEGDDPDCTNALLGGELKMHMDITEEHID
ncbi:MAG TPA: hypothetical protein IAD08_03735 [Candidatus Scatovivens faecipullorum]|jgi:hypothetical protein|nr:hypothetical protein [Candidatus Scatovivens faecipullorum]